MSGDNPFSSPVSQSKPSGGDNAPTVDGFVKQVPVVGILMIVGGALEFLMGALFIGIAFFMPRVLEQAMMQETGNIPAEELEFVKQVSMWVYCGMGGGALLGGLIRLLGGIQVVRFRSHALGIVANFAGLFSLSTCYCTPVSLGISIYGLIVLFQRSVRAEFLGRKG